MTPEDILKLYETRINLHQFDQIAPLLSNDAVFWFSDGSHTGIDKIKGAFERTWQEIQNEVYWLEELNWIAAGDNAASCIYRFHWKGIIDGQLQEGYGRGTTVMRKVAGQWKIVHEHLSSLPR